MIKKLQRQIKLKQKDLENKKEDVGWNLIREPVILRKKDITLKKDDPIYDDFPELKPVKKEKVALVLGGGGAKGVAHIGVLRELQKYNVDVDFIVGTSMGAIIGAAYALEKDISVAQKFIHYKKKDLIDPTDFSFSLTGLIKGKKVEELLRTLYGNATFKDTKIPLIINAVDVVSGQEVLFKEGKILDAVRASMSLPIIFAPKKIKGRIYFDGGVKDNLPYKKVPKKYKKVIVSTVTSKVPELKKTKSGIHYFMHFLSLLEHNTTVIPKDKRHIVIHPDMHGITLGDFHMMEEAVERGEVAAKDILPKHFKKIIE